ncbi:hypothetical protein BDV33DRAFT_228967 [Aspergillus novoparasiticus]|uniref:Uncharacterized protein n=1 Tax=Aspergillus novoparasiticus TaxID=986946 RepID=A0A5N6EZD8_9EURO|nr:hypothetical protein BDV33DRAFT_228967 [Aspergillus novoparasiticus]
MGFKLRKQPKSRLNAGSSATPKSQVHWRPCYLRRRVLLLFLFIFVAMIAALEALHRVSSAHYGLGSSVENLHYSWTYGPTAILTVVAAFWSRVEFQAKQNAPWQAMQENPQKAHTSVLMDYVSMIQPLSLLESFKNGHLMVAAGVICSMLLRILTIFSTGLLSLQQLQLTVAKGNASNSVGSALVNENRACLGATSLMAIATIIYVPSSKDTFVPWNPNRISSIAAIISNSSSFRKVLQGTGAVPMGVLEGLLVGRKFYTPWALDSNNFSIEIADDGRGEFDLDYEDISLTWRPFPSFIFRMITFIMVALVIAALEATLHVSQANNGLGDVSTDTYTHFIWTLVPALAMVLISLLFMSLDFNTRCLAPYADLRRAVEGSTFTQSMEINYLDSLSLVNAVKSVRMKHFAVSATTTAALISSLLTIISSGLYSAINVPMISKFDFIQETTWRDMADTYLSALYQQIADDEGEGVAIAGYILLDNLTFPKWTYGDLAFPQISPKSSIAGNSEGIFVDVTIPALRTSLSCKLQSNEELNATVVHNDNGITNSTLLSLDFNNWFGPISPHSIFGYLYEPNCVNSSSNAEEHNYVLPYRHQITYVWGEMGNGAQVQSVMALSCLDSPETFNTTTRFSLPNLEITQGMPPLTDESSAEIAPHLFVPFLKDAYLPFFEVLVSSKYSITRTDLGDESKKEKAQQFSQFVRASANGTLANDLLHGNITSRDRQRLIQDAVSTRTLEALLVSMIILGIWGSALLNTDAILPKNPCSIASVASLLADSNFLDRYKKVIDDPSSKSTAQALFPNSRFLLDWWNDGPLSGTSTEHRGLETDDRFTIYLIDENHGLNLVAMCKVAKRQVKMPQVLE